MSVTRTAMGTNQGKGSTLVTVGLTAGLTNGDFLVVGVAVDDSTGIDIRIQRDASTVDLGTIDLNKPNSGNVCAVLGTVVAGGTKSWDGSYPNVRVSFTNSGACAVFVTKLSSLAASPKDKYNSATGSAATAYSGQTPTLSQSDEMVIGVCAWEGPNGDTTNDWSGSTPSGFNAGQSIGTTGSGANSNVKVDEGYMQLSGTTGPQGQDVNSNSRDWACLVYTFKALTGNQTPKDLTAGMASFSATLSRQTQPKLLAGLALFGSTLGKEIRKFFVGS